MDGNERERRFTDWVRDHGAILDRTARGFAPPADRDDLMQELLLALWKALPAFRGESSPATFLYRVSHNAALTWKRGRRGDERLESLEPAPGTPALEPTAPAAPSPADRERLELLYAGIRRLPPLDRSLLLLSLDGVGYGEIGTLHGLTTTNVGARLTRARQRLALDLEGRRK